MNHPLRWLALVALDAPEMPSRESVTSWYAEHHPTGPPPVPAGSTDRLQTYTIGDYTAAATLVPTPIPRSRWEGPASAAWYWPGAEAALQTHRAHLLVTLVDEGGPAVTKASMLTKLSAALAATARTTAVFWGPGRLVHPRDGFLQQADTIADDNLPLFLWVDFRVETVDESAVRLFTTGLEALGGTELEVPRFTGPGPRLIEYVYNIAHYQLAARKEIRDGDAIGVAENVQAVARNGPSMLQGHGPAILLDFDGDEAGGAGD